MEVVAQPVLQVDNRLSAVPPLPKHELRKDDWEWFIADENEGYFSDDFVQVNRGELNDFRSVSANLFSLLMQAAQRIADRNAWKEAGIPTNAIPLISYSLRHEKDNYLVGRFDFAGGIEGKTLKMLEINADTCSLMPETAFIQELYWEIESKELGHRPFNLLIHGLKQKFQKLLQQHPNKAANLLITTFGYEEDVLNMRVIERAANMAGFTQITHTTLDKVIFSPDEGVFVESRTGEYTAYDFWYKFNPWDILANEEPELFDILEQIIRNDLCVIMNPAFSMLLQSKAIMKFMYDLSPRHENLLKTTFNARDFYNHKYVRKPSFGRMGENIAYHDGDIEPEYETEGDYEDFDKVYQEIAPFNIDRKDHRYQPSVFYTHEPCGIAIRRQDDLIIDDDAEFVGHTVARM